jgi:hypothetical protein
MLPMADVNPMTQARWHHVIMQFQPARESPHSNLVCNSNHESSLPTGPEGCEG